MIAEYNQTGVGYKKIQEWKRNAERIRTLKKVATFVLIAIAFLAVMIWAGGTFPY